MQGNTDQAHLFDYNHGDERYEGYVELDTFTETQRKERIKWLWLNFMKKAKGAALIDNTFEDIQDEILQYGTVRGLNDDKKKVKEVKKSTLLISPHNPFKTFWNIVMIFLLGHTALVVPFRVSYVDESSTMWFWSEMLIDLLFIFDLVLSFFSAYEKEDGSIEWR